MKVRSTFRILVVFIALLTVSSHSVFGRGPRPTKPEIDGKRYAVLLIGDHEGIDETDVRNAALLIAQELQKQGISVSDSPHEVTGSGTIYRVVLQRSDEKILFRLSEENSVGTLLVEREILLEGIKEIASAVPRLVYALVHQEPIYPYRVLVNGGVFTAIVPVKEVLAPGVRIGFSIDRLSYAVDIGARLARGNTGYQNNREDYFLFSSLSFGGRYFFMKRNISPYIGGGLGGMFTLYRTTIRTPDSGILSLIFTGGWDYDTRLEEAGGIGAYGVLGVELLRFSRGQLKFELRVDRPFFKLPSQDVMPITLGIAGGFLF